MAVGVGVFVVDRTFSVPSLSNWNLLTSRRLWRPSSLHFIGEYTETQVRGDQVAWRVLQDRVIGLLQRQRRSQGLSVAQNPSFLHMAGIYCPLGSLQPFPAADLVRLEQNRKLGSARNWNPTFLSSGLQGGWPGEGIWGQTWGRAWTGGSAGSVSHHCL